MKKGRLAMNRPFSLRNYKKQRARLHTVVLFIDLFGENFSLIVKRAAVSSRPVQKGGMKKRVIF